MVALLGEVDGDVEAGSAERSDGPFHEGQRTTAPRDRVDDEMMHDGGILLRNAARVSGRLAAMVHLAELFDLSAIPAPLRPLFDGDEPWQVLARLDALLAGLEPERSGSVHPTAVLEGVVRIETGAIVGPHAFIQGPAWLMPGAQVGHGAYLRGGVVLAPDAHVLHASEVKRAVILAGARVPHFNYVGDSVIGHRVNLGAGVKLANLKAIGRSIEIEGRQTGLRKLGALIGDDVSIGCNAVLAPGTVIGPRTVVYHGATVRGTVPSDAIVKHRPVLSVEPRRTSGDDP
jgi:UDP-N-acetylglucosamine diphosphorylase / glucose-1-phosphate thymidylyltransferase / UDP-N-acetylgalactosamine diphosphorylase / glucosamine-1-phosphate N-acetyltransferase / galactosamine-1-phosphate N-acetyltransferase